jgi:hypothetical protein
VDPRLERIAKNEEVFRAANRELEQAEKDLGPAADGMLEVLCECGREGCNGVLKLTMSDYNAVHSQEDRFVVLPGHQSDEIERVVEDRGDYVVVDKFGEAEEIVENDES